MRLRLITILALAAGITAWAQEYRQVETRKNATVTAWKAYPTRTLDRMKGFKMKKTDPETDIYGGWKTATPLGIVNVDTSKMGVIEAKKDDTQLNV